MEREVQEKGGNEGELVLDVFETPTHFIVKAPLAGVAPENVEVSVEHGTLTIRGSRELDSEVRSAAAVIRECHWGAFSRSVSLPQDVEPKKTEASFESGVLTVKVLKRGAKD
ncbi:Hsp20/alpha crystallin family protein [Candidatus Uhrbacteria bacterium]|nr:Hsp20/alpha crystallin family protein [Candidatus Uhrbacteria bacterium]